MLSTNAVITGIGILSPIGIGIEAHLYGLKKGFTGLKPVQEKIFDHFIAKVPDFCPGEYIRNKKALKFFSQQTKFGCTAAELAIRDAHLTPEVFKQDSQNNALIIGAGNTLGLRPIAEALVPCVNEQGLIDYVEFGETGYRRLPPLWILSRLPNTTAGQISIEYGIQGLNYSIVNGVNSGIVALGEAFLLIKHGRAFRVICGGIEDEIMPDSFHRLLQDSYAVEMIEDSKPFCHDSQGFACSEGTALFIIETEAEALERQAKIYGEIVGYSNYYVPERCKDKQLAIHFKKCMLKALEMAGISPMKVDFIQASAGGIERLDFAEAMAIQEIFGERPFVTTAQAHVGNTLVASGSISVVFACLGLVTGLIAPLQNYTKLYFDPGLHYIKERAVEAQSHYCLINSFSHLGETCTIILKKRSTI